MYIFICIIFGAYRSSRVLPFHLYSTVARSITGFQNSWKERHSVPWRRKAEWKCSHHSLGGETKVLNVETNASKLHTKEIPFPRMLRQYLKDFMKFLFISKCCGWRLMKAPVTDVRYIIIYSTKDVWCFHWVISLPRDQKWRNFELNSPFDEK